MTDIKGVGWFNDDGPFVEPDGPSPIWRGSAYGIAFLIVLAACAWWVL